LTLYATQTVSYLIKTSFYLPKYKKLSDKMSEHDESTELNSKQNGERKFHEFKEVKTVKKDQWDNELEFLCSCITLSVGLGNVWR
jgi:hypothetical protein